MIHTVTMWPFWMPFYTGLETRRNNNALDYSLPQIKILNNMLPTWSVVIMSDDL